MIRLFVALRPPPAIRDALSDVMDGVPDARWQDDEQLHLTLRFIGEVDRPQAEDIAAALGQVHAPAPTVALAGVGSFDTRGRIDTLWADVAPAAPLARLAASVEQACIRAGLPPERRAFRPHITVARLNRASGPVDAFLAEHAGLTSAAMRFDHLVLYESHIGKDGAWYEPVVRYPLSSPLPRS